MIDYLKETARDILIIALILSMLYFLQFIFEDNYEYSCINGYLHYDNKKEKLPVFEGDKPKTCFPGKFNDITIKTLDKETK